MQHAAMWHIGCMHVCHDLSSTAEVARAQVVEIEHVALAEGLDEHAFLQSSRRVVKICRARHPATFHQSLKRSKLICHLVVMKGLSGDVYAEHELLARRRMREPVVLVVLAHAKRFQLGRHAFPDVKRGKQLCIVADVIIGLLERRCIYVFPT